MNEIISPIQLREKVEQEYWKEIEILVKVIVDSLISDAKIRFENAFRSGRNERIAGYKSFDSFLRSDQLKYFSDNNFLTKLEEAFRNTDWIFEHVKGGEGRAKGFAIEEAGLKPVYR